LPEGISRRVTTVQRSLSLKRRTLAVFVALSTAVAASGLVRAADPAATQPAAPEALALVNGLPIDRAQFVNALMSVAGARLFEQWVSTMVALQDCQRQGIQVTQDMVKAQKDQIFEQLAAQGVPESQREAAFQQVMASKNITSFEMGLSLQRAAALKALAKGRVDPTEEQVHQAFDMTYGQKVQLRDIVVPDMGTAEEIKSQAVDAKLSVPDIAQSKGLHVQEMVLSASMQNLQPQIKQIAFELKPGETSATIPISAANGSTTYHLLYCEKQIPPQSDVKFDAVKDKVRAELLQAMETQWGNAYLNQLMAQAKIEIKDPVLQIYYSELVKRVRAQQAAQAAATQPAAK
jgi:hypothetical protein